MAKLTPEIKKLIENQLKGQRPIRYGQLRHIIAEKYGLKISPATLSRTAKALNLQFQPGRKQIRPKEKAPARSIFLDCAGAFFLKGAELELGILETIKQLLATSTESAQARRVLSLAQKINATLLYAPVFGLKTTQDIADYAQKGLLYLTGQSALPEQKEIEQYLRFLGDEKLLLFVIKEVAKTCAEAQMIQISFNSQTFYLDGQLRTVWPNAKIPRYLNSTIYKARSYVKDFFLAPSLQHPLILQTCPGYTFLPQEMFNLIKCLEQAPDEPIAKIILMGRANETIQAWQKISPAQKGYFIAPLSPWQYANLQGTTISRDFQSYYIGPEKEKMDIADAHVTILNPQLNENIRVRAALIRRNEERMALITNITQPQERYIRKIAEHYFWRWPDSKVKTYYDLLEDAHQETLSRFGAKPTTTPLITGGYGQMPIEGFRLLLEYLHQYATQHFFSSEYANADFNTMQEKLYQHPGYLKVRKDSWQIFLRAFSQNELQKDVQAACQKFNQNSLKFPAPKHLHIYLQSKQ